MKHAVLDVYRKEPLPAEHLFRATAGITVLPHIGGHAAGRDEVVAGVLGGRRDYLAV